MLPFSATYFTVKSRVMQRPLHGDEGQHRAEQHEHGVVAAEAQQVGLLRRTSP